MRVDTAVFERGVIGFGNGIAYPIYAFGELIGWVFVHADLLFAVTAPTLKELVEKLNERYASEELDIRVGVEELVLETRRLDEPTVPATVAEEKPEQVKKFFHGELPLSEIAR
ncbi:MAG: hypothetical protein QW498_08375 [Thermofilum sp.]